MLTKQPCHGEMHHNDADRIQGVGLSGNFFSYFLFFFIFVLVICYLVHNVEAIHGLCKLQTALAIFSEL